MTFASPLISTDKLKEELGMTKASELLAALDAAGETLEQFGEHIGLIYNGHWGDYTVILGTSIGEYDRIAASGPTPRAAYAKACAKRSEKERKHAIETAVQERVRAEVEAEMAGQMDEAA